MGEREMILTLGAVFFFAMSSLSANRFLVDNSEVMWRSELEYNAISVAQSIIEEAKTRAFDVSTETGTPANPPSDFTYPLGPRYDEHYPNFTDMDDYHGLSTTISTPYGNFLVQATVFYVLDTNPDQRVFYKTFYKKLTVTVSSDYIQNNIVMSHVFGYYGF